ncbi:hypothetical protein Ddc_15613 [Ditylenchus destructor]|nr:hypothetical protein Ddc_15613 [Ditylenchus destructor]
MFANIISKRALSISRMVGSQVRPLTSIYGVEVKSTAKFSYSAAQRISTLNFYTKREKHDGVQDESIDCNDAKNVTDYKNYVILAEAFLVYKGFPDYITTAYIHNTFWMIDNCDEEGSYGFPDSYVVATMKDILPRNETCHAELLFIGYKPSIARKDQKFLCPEGVVIRILGEKQIFLKEFENRWAKDVTFVVNGEKCAGDRQYLSAISPVFKKMLQDHAQDEITLEGVESADVLQDLFLAVSPLRVQVIK